MAQVKAKTAVYLGNHGYRSEGEVFDYEGPEHKHLEPVKDDKGEAESEDTHNKGERKTKKG
jgi:hypothetical protein